MHDGLSVVNFLSIHNNNIYNKSIYYFVDAAKKADQNNYDDKKAYLAVQAWLQQAGTIHRRAQKAIAAQETV